MGALINIQILIHKQPDQEQLNGGHTTLSAAVERSATAAIVPSNKKCSNKILQQSIKD